MTTVALAWSEGDHLRHAELPLEGAISIGRAPGSAIVLPDPTVSREHAVIRFRDGEFILQNLSRTNPATVEGTAVAEPVALTDRARMMVGTTQLVFHDLAAAVRMSGPVCGHCGRENNAQDRDCWYCGTSLVYASSRVQRRHTAVFRVVTPGGEAHDVYRGEAFFVRPDGSAQVARAEQVPDGVPIVAAEDGGPILRLPAGEAAPLSAGAPAEPSRPLSTGDEVQLGAGRFLILVA